MEDSPTRRDRRLALALGAIRWDANYSGGTADTSWDDYMPRGQVAPAEDGTLTFVSDYED